jgi:phage baseplate assembly protein W
MKSDYVYSDFTSHLNIDANGNIIVLYDEEVIIQSIKHIMATLSGERVRSDIGGSLVRLLFEPMNYYTTENIRRILSSSISIYEPRVEIDQLVISPNYDLGAYDIRMELIIRSLNKRLTFPTRLRTFSQ